MDNRITRLSSFFFHEYNKIDNRNTIRKLMRLSDIIESLSRKSSKGIAPEIDQLIDSFLYHVIDILERIKDDIQPLESDSDDE
jgi:hypothetical protein